MPSTAVQRCRGTFASILCGILRSFDVRLECRRWSLGKFFHYIFTCVLFLSKRDYFCEQAYFDSRKGRRRRGTVKHRKKKVEKNKIKENSCVDLLSRCVTPASLLSKRVCRLGGVQRRSGMTAHTHTQTAVPGYKREVEGLTREILRSLLVYR